MPPEIPLTERPSALRLWSFLGLTLGGTLLCLGALMPWAAIPPFDATTTNGIDVWEGRLALLVGLAALIGMLIMRIVRSREVRTAIAAVVLVGGLATAAVVAVDATVAKDRFSGSEQRDRLARQVARETGEPYEDVRRLLERAHEIRFPVETRIGIWLTVVGGLVAATGGATSVTWARASATARPGPDTSNGSHPPPP